jgi:hypothetical protein
MLIRTPVHDATEIESSIGALAGSDPGGLVVVANTFTSVHRKQIIELANRFSVPAMYPYRYFAIDGGIVSYGMDSIDVFRSCRHIRRPHPARREPG